MHAAWYERQGAARDVLQVGEMPDPVPGPGEVRVRLSRSGVNPGDVKKRQDWMGFGMAYPRVIPHSDGAGVLDAVGDGVDASRVGRRVWVWGAQSSRPFGTAAGATVVPTELAVDPPAGVGDDTGACLGIPGITAHRAVFGDGEVRGATVLVQGVLGGVGAMAAQLARWGGATVIGTVRRPADAARVPASWADYVVAPEAEAIRSVAPGGVDRIVEVAFAANIALDASVAAPNAVIASYSSPSGQPVIPYWDLTFPNVSIRFLGSDAFPPAAKTEAASAVTRAAAEGFLDVRVAATFPLVEIAAAHELVEAGGADGRVLVDVSA